MCGLAGILAEPSRKVEELEDCARSMAGQLRHRGPDDSGLWVDAAAGVALGFRRLSIIDLSPFGHQPMLSPSGRFVIGYNGEIYNYRELRRELETAGVRFRGDSDTEVALAAFERWGIVGALRRFTGMFAFALWDRAEQNLTLARDRVGIKPLYYYHRPGLLTFGSELKALLSGPEFDSELDPDGLTAYLRYLYIPAPWSIFRRVRKLVPGCTLTIRPPAASMPEPQPFWSLEEIAAKGSANIFRGSEEEAIDELERLLRDSIQPRLRADVPLGALLSGGVDSSTVVSIMQSCSSRPIKTFTIGFDQAAHDESVYAAKVARHLSTEHTELVVTGDDALATVPCLALTFDEPFADPSQIPTFLVCKLARREVTVALSGDGGDEVFAGYNRYLDGHVAIRRALATPLPVRRVIRAGIGVVPPSIWDDLQTWSASLSPGFRRYRLLGSRLYKMRELLGQHTAASMYRSLLSGWQNPERVVSRGREPETRLDAIMADHAAHALVERMMLADQATYLPDDLLAKVDRASMAFGLEVRVPLIDHRVIEYSWTLPRALKIRDRQGKWLLRQVLQRRVPRSLIERPKVGFSVPIDSWLRGALRPWAEDLLSPESLSRAALLQVAEIRRVWESFLRRNDNVGLALWAVLMLVAWRERWLK